MALTRAAPRAALVAALLALLAPAAWAQTCPSACRTPSSTYCPGNLCNECAKTGLAANYLNTTANTCTPLSGYLGPGTVGCFDIPLASWTLNNGAANSNADANRANCRDWAAADGFAFYGMTGTTLKTCYGTNANLTTTPASSCTVPCNPAGTNVVAGETCGGTATNIFNVYQTIGPSCTGATYNNSGVCTPCGASCNACDAGGCTQCAAGTFRYKGKCEASCPGKTYLNTTDGVCIDCGANCTACDAGGCTQCDAGTVRDNGACKDKCSRGRFKNGDVCDNCRDGCADCTSLNDCASCEDTQNWVLFFGQYCTETRGIEFPCGLGAYNNNGTCTNCAANCDTCSGPDTCDACAATYYKNATSGATSCVSDCPAGTYKNNNGGNPICSDCDANCVTCSAAGPSSCTSCQQGRAGASCALCAVGSYSSDGLTCAGCSEGTTTAGEGGTAEADCTRCKAGYGGDTCTQCAIGTLSLGGNGVTARPACTTCAIGVGAGTTNLAPGSSSCPACVPGRGGATCRACSAGTWSAGLDALRPSCTRCPTGTTTFVQGATSNASCTGCAAGYGGSPCEACGPGKFSSGGSLSLQKPTCQECPTGTYHLFQTAATSMSCTYCKPGYGGSTCAMCGVGWYGIGYSTARLREPCVRCTSPLTSLAGSISSAQCVASTGRRKTMFL
ncbi:MAG: hypothetical protein J3K34DRAFT_485915 [Monoraphidium minutum]|nr:MAG: hypothetical protein J3K34DRAFT_485915 [Monoraphidium minutum]